MRAMRRRLPVRPRPQSWCPSGRASWSLTPTGAPPPLPCAARPGTSPVACYKPALPRAPRASCICHPGADACCACLCGRCMRSLHSCRVEQQDRALAREGRLHATPADGCALDTPRRGVEVAYLSDMPRSGSARLGAAAPVADAGARQAPAGADAGAAAGPADAATQTECAPCAAASCLGFCRCARAHFRVKT